ncbi:MAG TPA: NADH-quinone oxidoreductase subunit L [Pyrinomonadaceae bacterium]|nr:NADH-quinone oxidoreductase subunit L [Pyrinomonadaceae bacterium]
MENNLLSLIIFAPLIGAAINWFVGRRLRNEKFVAGIACAAVGVSTLIAFFLALKADGALRSTQPLLDHLWTWIQVGRFRADFGLAMDRLSGTYALFVSFVGFLIHLFAAGYMHKDPGFYRFFAYLNLFMFAMLTLVLADNFLLMFVGWEGVGLCSYLLIGYYTDRQEAGDAAKKAFITNRVGDWGFVIGVMLVFFLTGSVSFFNKPEHGVTSALQMIGSMGVDPFTWQAIFAGGITSVAVLLFIGAAGKSAQIPLYVWLPDAMAGPTPVSALIHAATMVTAGVYMIVRCSAIYTHAPTAMFIVAIIGAATAIFAATIGIAQNDIKKVLAYSTVSQLGYMFLACGVGAFVAAIFHVITHAFFKALLFLGSGSVIHGMHHEQDMRRMGGLKKYMPITFATMLTGWLAISGIPIFAGFFSKDEILWKVWSASLFSLPNPFWNKLLWFVGALTALLTAIYMTRMMVMTFWGSERFREQHSAEEHHEAEAHHQGVHEPHESPWIMTVPLIVLAVLSTVGGLIGVPYALGSLFSEHPTNYIEQTLEPVISHTPPATAHGSETSQAGSIIWLSPEPQTTDAAPPVHSLEGQEGTSVVDHATATNVPAAAHHSPEEISQERLLALVSVLIAATGIASGFVLFKKRPLLRMPSILENKYYVDEIYDAAIINPIHVVSREGLWKVFDQGVIDGILHSIGDAVTEMGRLVRHMQAGFVRGYAAIILFGALAVIGFFTYIAVGLLGLGR